MTRPATLYVDTGWRPGDGPGRAGTVDVTDLPPGADLRQPEHRRETFHRFYAFHLQHRAHPGCVYFLLPYLRDRYGWDDEQYLWFAFLNGNTQHPLTSLILHRRFPRPRDAADLADWFAAHYDRLAFDTDRRHHKKHLPEAAAWYAAATRHTGQKAHWDRAAAAGFPGVWAAATAIPSFGRLSAFSYAEYLRITGVPFDCDDLLLRDLNGSRSHRNGLARVLGRDDLDWHDTNPHGFTGRYTADLFDWLDAEAETLLGEARRRAAGQPWAHDVSYFTLESALCTYKSWHRPNRRYPGVYVDMLYDRIRRTQAAWPDEDLDVFWDARRDLLPAWLRLEDTPHDPGCAPIKQNHYLHTGHTVTMGRQDPALLSDFDRDVSSGRLPRRKDRP